MKKIFILKKYINYAFRKARLQTICYLFLQILYLFMPMIQMIIVSNFINNVQDIIKSGNMSLGLINPIILLVLNFVLSYLLKILTKNMLIRLSKGANYSFELSIIEKCSQLSYTTIENSDNNDLIERVSEKRDNAITEGINSIMEFLHIFVGLISIVILIVKSSILISLVAFVMLFLISYIAYQSGEREYEAYKIVRKHYRRARVHRETMISREYADERRLFDYADYMNKIWENEFDSGRRVDVKITGQNFLRIKGLSILMAILSFGIASILLVPLHSGELSVGLYISIVTEVFNLIQKMSWNLSNIIQDLIMMINYMIDYESFLQLPEMSDIGLDDDNQMSNLTVNSIIFKNVSFKYPNTDKYVINSMNFQLNSGNTYAFVGENGAGKSTIIKLLLGIYKDYEGEILINDIELRSISSDNWYKFFSIVYQDFARYQISMLDNIITGYVEDKNEKINEIVEHVGLSKLINSLPNGIDTVLGQLDDVSYDISGGEWQKIAIARALYTNNPVQILDEPTAALDPIMEKQIYNLFYNISKGDIKIMISHRLGGVRNADEIIVLNSGKIAEKGKHQYLLDKKGIYENMYEKQRSWYNE